MQVKSPTTPTTNVSFNTREVDLFRKMEMTRDKKRMTKSALYKIAMQEYYLRQNPSKHYMFWWSGTLVKIRTWYEKQHSKLKDDVNQRDARWHYRKRIFQINLMLSIGKEKEYLKSLDSLFLLDELEATNVEPVDQDQDYFKSKYNFRDSQPTRSQKTEI